MDVEVGQGDPKLSDDAVPIRGGIRRGVGQVLLVQDELAGKDLALWRREILRAGFNVSKPPRGGLCRAGSLSAAWVRHHVSPLRSFCNGQNNQGGFRNIPRTVSLRRFVAADAALLDAQ